MSDLIELERLINVDSAERGQAVSKLGYFCAPFRPASGPLANKVIKVYRGLRDVAELERLAQCHSDYVAALELTGGRSACDRVSSAGYRRHNRSGDRARGIA